MRVLLFGASGMVGQGVLRECLLDGDVTEVLSVVRRPTGETAEKLREIVHEDFADFSALEPELEGVDACFFCLGISSAGMKEADYRRVTVDFTLAAAKSLAKTSPDVTFVYVSGTGTDSTEKGRSMWARVKGEVENALLATFPKAVMFRPGYIQPMHGAKSRTGWTRALYAAAAPLYPFWKAVAPKYVTTTEAVGKAMLRVAKSGAPKKWLENDDINELGAA